MITDDPPLDSTRSTQNVHDSTERPGPVSEPDRSNRRHEHEANSSGLVSNFVRSLYNWVVRPRLPGRLAVCNGVVARRVKLFDRTDNWPEYEREFLWSIRRFVVPGDTVVEIGGGFGIGSVVAARGAGPRGVVKSFEAAHEQIEFIRETAELNGVADRIEVTHGIVGPDIDVWGTPAGADTVLVSELPEADVLVVDAEGAEGSIIDALDQRPRALIVEVHPDLIQHSDLTEPEDFVDHLRREGYAVTAHREIGDGNVHIVTGVRDSD